MDGRENLLERRRIVSLMLLAAEQAPRLVEVCASVSGDESSARRVLAEAFGVSEMDAQFILDMQVRRFTPPAIERTRSELADIDSQLDGRNP